MAFYIKPKKSAINEQRHGYSAQAHTNPWCKIQIGVNSQGGRQNLGLHWTGIRCEGNL